MKIWDLVPHLKVKNILVVNHSRTCSRDNIALSQCNPDEIGKREDGYKEVAQ